MNDFIVSSLLMLLLLLILELVLLGVKAWQLVNDMSANAPITCIDARILIFVFDQSAEIYLALIDRR